MSTSVCETHYIFECGVHNLRRHDLLHCGAGLDCASTTRRTCAQLFVPGPTIKCVVHVKWIGYCRDFQVHTNRAGLMFNLTRTRPPATHQSNQLSNSAPHLTAYRLCPNECVNIWVLFTHSHSGTAIRSHKCMHNFKCNTY